MAVLGHVEKYNESKLFSLAFLYLAKILSTNNCHLLSALLVYVKNHTNNKSLYILDINTYVCLIFIDEKIGVYQNLLHPSIHVDANGYVHASLFKIIQD